MSRVQKPMVQKPRVTQVPVVETAPQSNIEIDPDTEAVNAAEAQDFSFVFNGKAKTKEETVPEKTQPGINFYKVDEKALMFFTVVFVLLVIMVIYLAYKLYFQKSQPQNTAEHVVSRGQQQKNNQKPNARPRRYVPGARPPSAQQPQEENLEEEPGQQEPGQQEQAPQKNQKAANQQEEKKQLDDSKNKKQLSEANNILDALHNIQVSDAKPTSLEQEQTNDTLEA